MKQKIKELLCRIFGHRDYTEVYAAKCSDFWGFKYPKSDRHYVVVEDVTCERCGRMLTRHITPPMRRTQLLKDGWFITDTNTHCNEKN